MVLHLHPLESLAKIAKCLQPISATFHIISLRRQTYSLPRRKFLDRYRFEDVNEMQEPFGAKAKLVPGISRSDRTSVGMVENLLT